MINYDHHLGGTNRSAGTGAKRIHLAWKQQEGFLPSEKWNSLVIKIEFFGTKLDLYQLMRDLT